MNFFRARDSDYTIRVSLTHLTTGTDAHVTRVPELQPPGYRLRSYAGDEPFGEFVRKQLGPLQSQYERLRDAGRLALLCDGLNEMQRMDHGRNLVDEVRSYLRAP